MAWASVQTAWPQSRALSMAKAKFSGFEEWPQRASRGDCSEGPF